ncbi:hypothetical protein B0H16DRAFT_1469630 [Mycena metata]|uniref:Uncharacterized protein n=1 Tax=Mycena metata TaxID=1033252 RepID=A0AAD7HYU0_9AGAR|nr:hypothetical protein B0H16DRAFT_1469630 [Mycena metata]
MVQWLSSSQRPADECRVSEEQPPTNLVWRFKQPSSKIGIRSDLAGTLLEKSIAFAERTAVARSRGVRAKIHRNLQVPEEGLLPRKTLTKKETKVIVQVPPLNFTLRRDAMTHRKYPNRGLRSSTNNTKAVSLLLLTTTIARNIVRGLTGTLEFHAARKRLDLFRRIWYPQWTTIGIRLAESRGCGYLVGGALTYEWVTLSRACSLPASRPRQERFESPSCVNVIHGCGHTLNSPNPGSSLGRPRQPCTSLTFDPGACDTLLLDRNRGLLKTFYAMRLNKYLKFVPLHMDYVDKTSTSGKKHITKNLSCIPTSSLENSSVQLNRRCCIRPRIDAKLPLYVVEVVRGGRGRGRGSGPQRIVRGGSADAGLGAVAVRGRENDHVRSALEARRRQMRVVPAARAPARRSHSVVAGYTSTFPLPAPGRLSNSWPPSSTAGTTASRGSQTSRTGTAPERSRLGHTPILSPRGPLRVAHKHPPDWLHPRENARLLHARTPSSGRPLENARQARPSALRLETARLAHQNADADTKGALVYRLDGRSNNIAGALALVVAVETRDTESPRHERRKGLRTTKPDCPTDYPQRYPRLSSQPCVSGKKSQLEKQEPLLRCSSPHE